MNQKRGKEGVLNSYEEIIVDPNNAIYMSENGILYNAEKTHVIKYPSAKVDSEYHVPDSVIDFYQLAFEWTTNLKKIVLSQQQFYFDGISGLDCGIIQYYLDSEKKLEVELDEITEGSVYIEYKPNEFDVFLDPSNNGGNITVIHCRVGSTYGQLPEPTRPGYQFVGWYSGHNGGIQITSSSVVRGSELNEFFAVWEENPKHNVILNPNGGTVSVDSLNVIEGGSYGELPIPERTGYTFVGWYTSLVDGVQIKEGDLVTIK